MNSAGNTQLKNFVKVMQNTTGERNQLLLLSNPDLLAEYSDTTPQPSPQPHPNNASLPTP